MSIHTNAQPCPASCVPRSPTVDQRLPAGKQRLLGCLRRRPGSQDKAEDALQSFSLEVIRSSQSAGSEEKINARMGQILRNILIEHHRRRAVHQRVKTAHAAEMTIIEQSAEGKGGRSARQRPHSESFPFGQALGVDKMTLRQSRCGS